MASLLAAERRRRIDAVTEEAKTSLERRPMFDDQVGPAAMAVLLSADLSAKRPESAAAARRTTHL